VISFISYLQNLDLMVCIEVTLKHIEAKRIQNIMGTCAYCLKHCSDYYDREATDKNNTNAFRFDWLIDWLTDWLALAGSGWLALVDWIFGGRWIHLQDFASCTNNTVFLLFNYFVFIFLYLFFYFCVEQQYFFSRELSSM
jgi:hypothetical protein